MIAPTGHDQDEDQGDHACDRPSGTRSDARRPAIEERVDGEADVLRRVEREVRLRHVEHVGRDPAGVTLVAVSKTQPADAVRQAWRLGQRAFGENYVQEAAKKIEALSADALEWHLIGPLQSNKAKEAVALFDVIETVDREKIAAELAKETGIPFIEAVNHFEGNAQRDGLVECHGQLRTIAVTLFLSERLPAWSHNAALMVASIAVLLLLGEGESQRSGRRRRAVGEGVAERSVASR